MIPKKKKMMKQPMYTQMSYGNYGGSYGGGYNQYGNGNRW